jgi:NhaP-type Na+/H+ or K+/H+ antiporter
MDPYEVFLVVLGAAILASSVLPRVLRDLPLSLPIVQVSAGLALYLIVPDLPSPDPFAEGTVTERMSELVVIVSLTAAGLKIDRRCGWRAWQPTWRLLAIAMPLTIAGTALLGAWMLGVGAASALLLGAVLAPTDPVLASDVQVGGPHSDDESEVKVALTAEAGLNDALAFPFTYAAIALLGGGAWFSSWLLDDVLLKLTSGLAVGYLSGRAIGWLVFRSPRDTRLARTTEGIAALGATLLIYGTAELAHGYGFLAVFVAALVLRDHERDHEYHEVLHEATETVERIGSALLLLLVGGAIAEGGFSALGWREAAVACAVVFVVRPVFGWLSLLATPLDRMQRLVIAGFGIRGMGSIYYLAYAGVHADFPEIRRVWAVVLLTIVLSVLVHGATANRAVKHAEEHVAGERT